VNLVLAIDTASTDFALALALDGEVAASLTRDGAQDHSRLLLAAIDELLGARRANLAAVIAVRGPGSYAGLRVGLATAQGLALAAGVPIRGIGTMEAVAAASGLRDFTAIHPAGRGEFAVQDFRDGQPAAPLRVAAGEELRGSPNLAGEGAGALGGLEITPEARCRAALQVLLPTLATASDEGVEAIYLREPNITTPRRPAGAHTS
jgi:tRNA threonylcarbamoyladenosine biosynthesis protein TsaB